MFQKVSRCGMSDEIGPVHVKERPSSEMQSRIDAEVCIAHSFSLYILSLSVAVIVHHITFLFIHVGCEAPERSIRASEGPVKEGLRNLWLHDNPLR